MKNHQRVLELHPHLSKLLDSLCFELAVNIPDQNSLSLLQILDMHREGQTTFQELKELYIGWLEAKNVFDLFSAKQVRIFSKGELITNSSVVSHISINSINNSLQLLHELYDDMFQTKNRRQANTKTLKEVQQLFQYLDNQGNIHLRLSQLFFVNAALITLQNGALPVDYQSYKPSFKQRNKQLCVIQGMVSLRWFKNYFLFGTDNIYLARNIAAKLKEIQKRITKSQRLQNSLPNILEQAFSRWRNSSRFTGLFQSKKKKIQIYHRIFDQNQQIFFFNGGSDDNSLNQGYFIKKYGQEYIKSLQIDTLMLREFNEIVKDVLNGYLIAISRINQSQSARHHKSNSSYSAVLQTPLNNLNSSIHSQLNSSIQYNQTSIQRKPNSNYNKLNSSYRLPPKTKLQPRSSLKQKTPTKNNKGNDTKRRSITPNNKNASVSPFMNKQFGSTEKSLSQKKRTTTPTKSNHGYSNSLYTGPPTQLVYRNSKKQGLQKDSFYEKLFFFRNKRVESFDIVMKRLKGK